jgi:hypothetical protein
MSSATRIEHAIDEDLTSILEGFSSWLSLRAYLKLANVEGSSSRLGLPAWC